jgi:glycosyltransferase involved in cell wall biosynthesis
VIQCALDYLWPADSKTGSLAESFRRARRVWFVSRKNHELVEKQLGADIPADWIGNPIRSRPEVLPPWPAAPPFKMALVGRLEPLSKGQDLLFEALRSEKWKRRPLEISLFGEGRCRESLEALRRRWGLERVRFSGFEEDLESIWRAHHALVLPSRHEGLPLAVLEAAWFGRLSVVTDAGDCAELVRDGETGFVARGPSARDLDEALERAWARRTEWRAMGERARLEIRDRFTPDPSSVFAGAVERLAGAELC